MLRRLSDVPGLLVALAAGLPAVRVHDLRHASASLLLAEGVQVLEVSRMLGHSDIGTTLRVYGHLMPDAHTQAAGAMDRLFGTE